MYFVEHSMDYIIKRVRKEDRGRSMLSFVVKKDLRNIIAQYNMQPGWRHKNYVVSVQLRCDENNPDDGIRLFEAPHDQNGEGFLMVIITPRMLEWLIKYSSDGINLDDTFNTTRYPFKLATLMVTDHRDRGLPGAFLLSASMTAAEVRTMFLIIRSLVPDFAPKRIVTDEAACFYNGYRAVFPQSKTQLHYCRHIVKMKETFCDLNNNESIGNPAVEDQVPASSVTEAQIRQDERWQKLSIIKRVYATIEANATARAKCDTDEAVAKLDLAIKYLNMAATALHLPQTNSLAARPEMQCSGTKPKLSKLPIYQVRKS
ncbi:unnamed protein product [Heligmosomoides polygyrus]|uniref:MULE domain-containing protein n=1 Tax=Heligmosomoides polygyrus TaxID=6339 RepID=A0A183GBJ2_HELPZ|nr:unnamed protein product [Heligmosomoides polygyrus]